MSKKSRSFLLYSLVPAALLVSVFAVVQAQNAGPKPGQPKQGGSSPAAQSAAPGPAATNTDLSQAIEESQKEWGRISPRVRDAVLEGATEQPLEKYKKLIDDYYRGVSTERQ